MPFEIISQNLVEIKSKTRQCAEINNDTSTYFFAELFPFVIFSIDVQSITLIPLEIISQNLVEI